MKHEGSNSYQSKDMANVKFFADKQMDKRTNRQTKGPKPIRCKRKMLRFHLKFVQTQMDNNYC